MTAPKPLLKGFARRVATIKPDSRKRKILFDPDTRGLCVRVTPKGRKTFTIVARNPAGRQIWKEVANAGEMPLEEARELAREGVKRIKRGEEPFPTVEPPTPPESFGAVAENFIKRHVRNPDRELRSASEIERIFNRYVLPEWKTRAFVEIRRGDVSKLLDQIEDNNGPVMADRVLAALSMLSNWHAARSDDYASPIVRGMRRTKPKERERKRLLSDDEIRLIWPILDDMGRPGAFVKLLLLTAQRRAKVAAMRWQDIDEHGVWTIPAEPREKTNPGRLPLPGAASSIIRAQTVVENNPYVFPGRGKGYAAGFQPVKRTLDKKILEALQEQAREAGQDPSKVVPPDPWVLHDLRRTAKSLMARARVRPDISERVLGHVITGVEGVYDRHPYDKEKGDALRKLAEQVDLILKPARENVVALHAEV